MIDYLKVAKNFEDRVDIDRYYETRAFIKVKEQLASTLQKETKQILFLIGEPGTGKSLFVRHMGDFLEEDFDLIQYNTPFFEPVDFIKNLIEKRSAKIRNFTIEALINQAIELYKESNTIVTIDEAQLLSDQMVELLRILADSKAFWFLLAMHKYESKQILQKPQFRSRPHRVFLLESLHKDEVADFLAKELLSLGEESLLPSFKKSLIKRLHHLSKGNFRELKKLLNRMFLLMDRGVREGRKGYERPNECLLIMAAIDGGLLEL